MNLFILIFLLAAFILLSSIGYGMYKRETGYKEPLGAGIAWTCGILSGFAGCILVVWIVAYPASIARIGELEGIRDSVISYESIARQVKSARYEINDINELQIGQQKIILGLENLKQSTKVSESLEELRGIIIEYNKGVSKYARRNRNVITRFFMVKFPEDLKIIVVSENILK